MTKRLYILLTLLTVMAVARAADQASFELIRPGNVEQGRNFALTFRLTDGEANPPAAPELEGCTLLYGPATSTMNSTQIVNGRISSTYTIDYTFTYRADTPGTVQVPAVSINTRSGRLSSRAASFTILPADSSGKNQARQGAGSNRRNDDDDDYPTAAQVSPDDLLVRVTLSKSSVYEQEPIVATIKVYTKLSITSFLPTVQPAFEGFLTEELPINSQAEREHYNGQNYYAVELKKLLLYPQRPGRLTVNSGKFNVTIVVREPVSMGFFRTMREIEKQVTTTSNAASVQVLPLPEPKPANFSGAVGQFTAKAELDPELMHTNEASEFTYIIRGTGNIKFLPQPQIEFPVGIDSYTPRTDIDAHTIAVGTNMSGTYKLQCALVPQEVGNFVIEGHPFVYFNPASGKYETAEVADIPVRVLRGAGSVASEAHETRQHSIEDILYIHPQDGSTHRAHHTYVICKTYYWVLYALILLGLVSLVLIYRRRLELLADVSGQRLAKAKGVATKRLKEAHKMLKEGKNDEFYASLASALWGYLSDKLNIPASQLTRQNIEEKLRNYGVNDVDTQNIMLVLDDCEMARFTPNADHSVMQNLYETTSRVISNVERVKKH